MVVKSAKSLVNRVIEINKARLTKIEAALVTLANAPEGAEPDAFEIPIFRDGGLAQAEPLKLAA